ncbi:MAG: hypothetical protein KDC75_19860, partial [Phaeodactylibacter sp.]|nr:hypothetical protein [Phaeodactylibacter sp.]
RQEIAKQQVFTVTGEEKVGQKIHASAIMCFFYTTTKQLWFPHLTNVAETFLYLRRKKIMPALAGLS